MGLILAAMGAAGSVLADQWKEFFTAESMPSDVLMMKGRKTNGRSGFNMGDDNIITKGSGVVVNYGQCAIIVDNGEIVDVCAEPGSYTYDDSTEPTIFCGDLKQGLKDSWEKFKVRFTMGGATGHDQRIYFFNTKEMLDNKFGTPNPIPFRAVDRNINLDLDTALKISGVYSLRMADPVLFYKSVAGNVSDEFTMDDFGQQLKAEFMQALQPAVGELSKLEIRPSGIPEHVNELTDIMNNVLSAKWATGRGFEIVSIALNPVIIPEEDAATIKELQKAATMKDPTMAAASLASAQADAMRTAAANEGGAMNGFVGMGMAMNAGGANTANLFQMGQQQAQAAQAAPQAGSWTCGCGTVNTGNFCSNCGAKKPEVQGKFCPNCGNPVDAGAKFCPNCGQAL